MGHRSREKFKETLQSVFMAQVSPLSEDILRLRDELRPLREGFIALQDELRPIHDALRGEIAELQDELGPLRKEVARLQAEVLQLTQSRDAAVDPKLNPKSSGTREASEEGSLLNSLSSWWTGLD